MSQDLIFNSVQTDALAIVPKLLENYDDQKTLKKAINKVFKPQNIIYKKITTRLKNGKLKKIQAIHYQYNDARGPFSGGVRMSKDVSEDIIKSLSFWETLKSSIYNLPLGGSMSGIAFDQEKYLPEERSRVVKNYVDSISKHLGPWKDILTSEVGTDCVLVAKMLETFEKKKRIHSPATFSGKPVELGGSLNSQDSVGLGALYILTEQLKHYSFLRLRKISVSIHGFGRVGYGLAKVLSNAGYKVISVCDKSGAIYDQNGLVIEKLGLEKRKFGSFRELSLIKNDYKFITTEEFFNLDSDILALASSENAVNEETAKKIKSKVILELANFAVNSQARKIILSNKIEYIPDLILAGASTISTHLEWVQSMHGFRWGREEINTKLRSLIIRGFNEVKNVAIEHKLNYYDASLFLGLKRVVDAIILRGRV